MVDFIFMLTRQDQTIEDCIETFECTKHLGVRHIGFKDVGVDFETLRELNRRIQASGATSYMEVVSTTPRACLDSAGAAREIGVNRLLGGTDAEAILNIIAGSDIEYFPFPGKPEGHPTRLGGAPQEIADDCRRFQSLGCHGVDLLAYRAIESRPCDLVRAAREATDGYLIIAGSVDSPQRIQELGEAGADAFTVGSAVFDGSFSQHKGATASQLKDILAACG
ncbi:MAG: hypothetical protein OEU36_17280 [Gammaproteobacteria bacterium]|nr:hypothetical protein [Gammaproteobacteria bacterium]